MIGAIGILRDMRELDKAQEAAEIANRAKSQFLANMSHELRTPLNAIILYTELLRDEATDQGLDDFLPDLKKIHGAAKHLLALINDVLDLAKIESGKTGPAPGDVRRRRPWSGTWSPPSSRWPRRTPTCWRSAARPTSGTMHADLTKVRQSLFNLLSNACKFTEGGHGPPGGRPRGRRDGGLGHLPGDRHGHRHHPRAPGQAVQAVLPGGPVGHAPVRRHRAWGWRSPAASAR